MIWDLRAMQLANKWSHPNLEKNGELLHEDAGGSELKPRKQMNPCTSLKLNSAYHFPPTELSCGKDQRVPLCRKGWLVGCHGCEFLFFFRTSAISLTSLTPCRSPPICVCDSSPKILFAVSVMLF